MYFARGVSGTTPAALFPGVYRSTWCCIEVPYPPYRGIAIPLCRSTIVSAPVRYLIRYIAVPCPGCALHPIAVILNLTPADICHHSGVRQCCRTCTSRTHLRRTKDRVCRYGNVVCHAHLRRTKDRVCRYGNVVCHAHLVGVSPSSPVTA
jgi:hypothetical protein